MNSADVTFVSDDDENVILMSEVRFQVEVQTG